MRAFQNVQAAGIFFVIPMGDHLPPWAVVVSRMCAPLVCSVLVQAQRGPMAICAHLQVQFFQARLRQNATRNQARLANPEIKRPSACLPAFRPFFFFPFFISSFPSFLSTCPSVVAFLPPFLFLPSF
jgi:hypothetical protein